MQALDLLTVYQFIRRLVTPFDQWEAYKRGIIDADGNVLRKRKTLGKTEERDAWGYLDIITCNLKKLLAKLPGGSTAIATYAAAFLLLRESERLTDDDFIESLEENTTFFADDLQQIMNEEAPANAVGDGSGIAGTTGEPPVDHKRRKKLLSKLIRRTEGTSP